MNGQIINDYETLKAGAQAMSQFGQSLQQMGRQLKLIHQQLKEHCADDASGLGAAVDDVTSAAAHAGGEVFFEGGRVLGEMGSRTNTNTERTFGTDQAIAETCDSMAHGDPPRPPDAGANQSLEYVRPYGPGQGSLRPDDPVFQRAMEAGFPKDAQGDPVAYADPRTGWVAHGNDGGPGVNGRANNCADCSRSFMESWYGRPTCSQPRIPDLTAQGIGYTRPERDANRNIATYTGASPSWYGEPSSDPYRGLAGRLLGSGPGSAAIVQVAWRKSVTPTGDVTYQDGHAFNACNVDGHIVWVDMQSNRVSDTPIHPQAAAVWATVLDANERPVPSP